MIELHLSKLARVAIWVVQELFAQELFAHLHARAAAGSWPGVAIPRTSRGQLAAGSTTMDTESERASERGLVERISSTNESLLSCFAAARQRQSRRGLE